MLILNETFYNPEEHPTTRKAIEQILRIKCEKSNLTESITKFNQILKS